MVERVAVRKTLFVYMMQECPRLLILDRKLFPSAQLAAPI